MFNSTIQIEPCKHVRNCFDCNTIGVSLRIDQQVLESFRVPQTVKQVGFFLLLNVFVSHFCLKFRKYGQILLIRKNPIYNVYLKIYLLYDAKLPLKIH